MNIKKRNVMALFVTFLLTIQLFVLGTGMVVFAVTTTLDRCDSASGWSGSSAVSLDTTNMREGTGCLTRTASTTSWFYKTFSPAVNTGVTESNGYLHLWLYVADVTKFSADGQIEITSSGASDVNEYAWLGSSLSLVNGWNELYLKISNAIKTGTPNLSAINYFRVYRPLSASITCKIDDLKFTDTPSGATPTPTPAQSPTPTSTPAQSPTPTATPTSGGTPDLIVTDISWTPASPNAGNAVTFSATVMNQGTGATPGGVVMGIGFYLDGATGAFVWSDNYTTSLAAGASITLTVNGGSSGPTWTATAGTHSIKAWVDDVNRIAESNETNNQYTESLSVGGGATPTPTKTPTPTTTPTLTPGQTPATIRFVVMADSRGTDNGYLNGIDDGTNGAMIEAVLARVKMLNPQPQFAVIPGDLVGGSIGRNVNELVPQLQNWRSHVTKYYPITFFYPIPGNHEIVGTVACEQAFSNAFPEFTANFLSGYYRSVYYFDVGNTRFFALNSNHYNESHKITGSQFSWLQANIDPTKAHNIFFAHEPAWGTWKTNNNLDVYPADRDKFWDLVDSTNRPMYFTAHEHNYSRRHITSYFNANGYTFGKYVYQITTGGFGGPLNGTWMDNTLVDVLPIGKYHFTLVDINGNNITITAIDKDGNILDSFTQTTW